MLVEIDKKTLNTDNIISISKIHDGRDGDFAWFTIEEYGKNTFREVFVKTIDFFGEDFPNITIDLTGQNKILLEKYKPMVMPKIKRMRDTLISYWAGDVKEVDVPIIN